MRQRRGLFFRLRWPRIFTTLPLPLAFHPISPKVTQLHPRPPVRAAFARTGMELRQRVTAPKRQHPAFAGCVNRKLSPAVLNSFCPQALLPAGSCLYAPSSRPQTKDEYTLAQVLCGATKKICNPLPNRSKVSRREKSRFRRDSVDSTLLRWPGEETFHTSDRSAFRSGCGSSAYATGLFAKSG